MSGRRRPPENNVWLVRMCWFLLIVALYGGVVGLNSLLHPHGKHDMKAVPIALYALGIVTIGGGLISWVSRK